MTKEQKLILMFAVLTGLFKLLVGVSIPPVADEFYYWVWSKHPDFSYMDHPPLLAWSLTLFSSVFGDSHYAFRSLSALYGFVNIWALGQIALLVYKEIKVVSYFFALSLILPAFLMSVVYTPDVFVGTTLSLTLLFLIKYDLTEKRKYLYFVAIAFAFSLLAKYTAAVYGGIWFLWLIWRKPNIWKKLEFWLAGVIVLLGLLPILYWNSQNDWISLRFQLNHGLGSEDPNSRYIIEFILSQPLYLGLPLGFVFIYCILRELLKSRARIMDRKSEFPLAWLLIVFIASMVFFAYASIGNKIEPNWTFFSWQLVSIIFAYYLKELWNGKKKIWKYLIIGNTLFLALLFGLVIEESLFNKYKLIYHFTRIEYWKNELIPDLILKKEEYNADLVVGQNYQNAAKLAYLLDQPNVPGLAIDTRISQFNYLDNSELLNKKMLVLAESDPEEFLPALSPYFKTLEPVTSYELVENFGYTTTYYLYLGEDFQTTPKPK